MFMELFTLTLSKKSLSIQVSFIVPLLRFLTVSFLLISFSSSSLFIGEASSISRTPRPCIHDHFSALIQLKRGFHFDEDSNCKLSSWNYNDSDCCTWEGIGCDNATGHVISLDLSDLGIRGQIDFQSLFRLHSLRELSLLNNVFYGQIPLDISRLTNLVSLDLSYNRFSGPLPSSLVNLTNLEELLLSDNNFRGSIPLSYASEFRNLRVLYLSYNSLSGIIPASLFSLPSLQLLNLDNNQFSGHVGEFDNASSSSLDSIFLDNNDLQGPIPRSIFRIPWINRLDLSNNRINGEIPKWIWKETLQYLNLSNNSLTGSLPPLHHLSLNSLRYLDLSYNMLRGSVPIPPPSIRFFLMSSNKFSGEIHSLFCNSTSLSVLDLSENNLSGQIPQCFGEVSDALSVLNLRRNVFNGTLLLKFKKHCNIRTLDLNGNQLKDRIPRSLANCKMLEVLDLGNNQIQDTFPLWLESLSQLRVLILAHNNFHGPIRLAATNHTVFRLLQIMDLSSNNFTGSFPPSLFWSCKPMIEEDRSNSQLLHEVLAFLDDDICGAYYRYTFAFNRDPVTLYAKGIKMELVKVLTTFTSIDISNNQFQGEIPKSFGNLKSLHGLNMSHNNFTGEIPPSFGNLRDLEWLDLSQNKLTGEIPWNLTELTFLEVLNLSENLLTGKIPQSRQFLTFTNESFQGNSGLCGPPLSKECGEANVTEPLEESESEAKINWRSMWIGFGAGYGVGFGIFFWTLALWRNGMIKFKRFTDKVIVLLFRS